MAKNTRDLLQEVEETVGGDIDLTTTLDGRAGVPKNIPTRFETGISENYLPDWGVVHGIREFIQNAVFAHSALGDSMDILLGDGYNSIKNSPSGISRGKLLVGESEQRDIEGSPGYFGEGLKCGMLVLLRNNRQMTFQTNGFTVVPALEPSALDPEVRTLVFYIYETDLHEGTIVEIECTEEEVRGAEDYFIILKGVSSDTAKTNTIISSLPGMISVNGVKIADYKSIMGYNLTNPKLMNRDRGALDKDLLDYEVKQLVSQINDVELAVKILEGISSDSTFLESSVGISSWMAYREVWRDASLRVFGKKCAMGTGSESDTRARYRKYKILVGIPSAWKYFFEDVLGIPSTSDLDTIAEKNSLVHAKPKGDLAQNLGWAKRLITMYYGDYGTVKVTDYLMDEHHNRCDGLYDRKTDTIWLDSSILDSKQKTFTTLLHETIHKLTGTEDNTSAFTREWEYASWMILTRGRGE